MPLDAWALKNLCLWCQLQSRLLFIISLLQLVLKNFLTALKIGTNKSLLVRHCWRSQSESSKEPVRLTRIFSSLWWIIKCIHITLLFNLTIFQFFLLMKCPEFFVFFIVVGVGDVSVASNVVSSLISKVQTVTTESCACQLYIHVMLAGYGLKLYDSHLAVSNHIGK